MISNKVHLSPPVQIDSGFCLEPKVLTAKYSWRFRTAASDKQRERSLVDIIELHKNKIQMWEFFWFFVKHGEIQSLEPFLSCGFIH